MRHLFWVITASWILLSSCSGHETKKDSTESLNSKAVAVKESFPVDSVISSVSCRNNASQSFALYIPPHQDDSLKLPVIIFFDPHGKGSFPLKKYRLLAKQFGYILMGSNDSRNGLSAGQTNEIANTLVAEAQSRLAIDEKRIIFSGFSGGAKVAIAAGNENPIISQIIYSGASSLPEDHNRSLSLLGFAGINDMNYAGLIAFDQSLDQTNDYHYLIEWNGTHEWPDSSVFTDAFYWCTFYAMKNHAVDRNNELIAQFIIATKNDIAITTDLIQKAAILEKVIFFLKGLEDVSDYSGQLTSIQKSGIYQKAMSDKMESLRQEQLLERKYLEAFEEKDLDWWRDEIIRMNRIDDPKQKPMYHRLLGFLSLASYSIAGNEIQQNQFQVAEKVLAIYKMADPKNPDQPFLKACLYARQNQNKKALSELEEAIRMGLNDTEKIMKEPALQSMQSEPEFQKLIAALETSK